MNLEQKKYKKQYNGVAFLWRRLRYICLIIAEKNGMKIRYRVVGLVGVVMSLKGSME